MPGVEPGSENKTIKTPTFIVYVYPPLADSPLNRAANLAVQKLHLMFSHRLTQVN